MGMSTLTLRCGIAFFFKVHLQGRKMFSEKQLYVADYQP